MATGNQPPKMTQLAETPLADLRNEDCSLYVAVARLSFKEWGFASATVVEFWPEAHKGVLLALSLLYLGQTFCNAVPNVYSDRNESCDSGASSIDLVACLPWLIGVGSLVFLIHFAADISTCLFIGSFLSLPGQELSIEWDRLAPGWPLLRKKP